MKMETEGELKAREELKAKEGQKAKEKQKAKGPEVERFLCDAHCHLGKEGEQREREEKKILSLVCASCPQEAEALEKLAGNSMVVPTFGLHPWYAAEYRVSDMSPFFCRGPVIGEIGMDSVWCDVPLKIQEKVFREQLEAAAMLKKPVILHTKGQEKEIAGIISRYPNTYLVHWYSGEKYLEQYLDLDCYFSIGPDVWWNSSVARTASLVPVDRLLSETDGLGAVCWAYENAPSDRRKRTPETVGAALEAAVDFTAGLRGMTPEAMAEQMYRNLVHGFLGR